MATQPTVSDQLRATVFTPQGVVDSIVGPVVFLVLYRVAGLDAALIGAGAVAFGLLGFRRLRGQQLTTAWYGIAGVAIGAGLAKATGSSDGFFLPKVVGNAVYATAFIVSVLIGKPLVGVVWALFNQQPIAWGIRPEVRRVFGALTLMWGAGYLLRLVAYTVLIADDEDRTGSLATVSVALGLPLTAALLAVSIFVVKWRLGPLARPAAPEPAAPEPVAPVPESVTPEQAPEPVAPKPA